METKTFFIDIDGTILKQYPFTDIENCQTTEDMESITEPFDVAIRRINEWFSEGHHVVFTTARPESFREFTVEQLAFCGVQYSQLVMGIGRSTRVLINNLSDDEPNETRAQAYQVYKNDKNAFTLIDE